VHFYTPFVFQNCVIVRPHKNKKIGNRPFLEEKVGRASGNFFKIIFYRQKNESMEQLNALKSCLFSPGVI